jgi:endonuclease-3
MARPSSPLPPRKPRKAGKVRLAWPPQPERVKAILEQLTALYGEATCALNHASPFQLLCATILSAQCTDERVNQVTPALFARFPTPAAMAEADVGEVETLVHSTGFFRHKAKNLVGAARLIQSDYAGQVPPDMERLLRLPGVARKTANVVLGTSFGIAVGVVVDTHVARLSQRLGLTRAHTPAGIEEDLMRLLPRDRWILFSHQLIWHGRRVCPARRPQCDRCPLAPHCPGRQTP